MGMVFKRRLARAVRPDCEVGTAAAGRSGQRCPRV